MYLSNLKLWNFRKFGSDGELDINKPNLDLNFSKGLNVLIGENDSGKSAIIDAIKIVLRTHSYEWIRISQEDFYNDSDRFRIELTFDDIKDEEAKHFIEWLGWYDEGENIKPFLRVIYDVHRTPDRIYPKDVAAGADETGKSLTAEAREYLKVTYLKPLRDASSELVPKKNSRLSQIFREHAAFRGRDDDHPLIELFKDFNNSIEKYFDGKDKDENEIETHGKNLKDQIDTYIHAFYGQSTDTEIKVLEESSLTKILEKLGLFLQDEINPGLGTLNRLFIASELVHLNKQNWYGLRIGLIEELEAHLHPQAQMRIIESLQSQEDIQLILTTHSPNLASKVKLKNLIICSNSKAFPMGNKYTELDVNDYQFLERFLDVTKANLFFAKGVIFVEGWSEEILLPALARKMKSCGVIKKDLTEAGVSVVNIGGTAFLSYSRIFLRSGNPLMEIPISIITDVDVQHYKKQDTVGENENIITDYIHREEDLIDAETDEKILKIKEEFKNQTIDVFIAPNWTLEYCMFKSELLSEHFQKILKVVHPQIDEAEIEKELAKKLIIGTLNKTRISYLLADLLDTDNQRDQPEIILDENDSSIKYLIQAVKHAITT